MNNRNDEDEEFEEYSDQDAENQFDNNSEGNADYDYINLHKNEKISRFSEISNKNTVPKTVNNNHYDMAYDVDESIGPYQNKKNEPSPNKVSHILFNYR